MNQKKKKKGHQGRIRRILFFLFLLSIFILYLWGKVHMDVILRENDSLISKRDSLKYRIDNLKLDLNQKRSYQRITKLAAKEGLIFISPSRIFDLEVNIKKYHSGKASERKKKYLKYAGLWADL